MKNLQHGDVFLPPDANTTSSLEIIPVHDDMHSQIECNRNPGHSGETDELRVGEQSGCAVVISMEEGQRLLLEDEKDRVEEFEKFGEMVQLRQSATAKIYRFRRT